MNQIKKITCITILEQLILESTKDFHIYKTKYAINIQYSLSLVFLVYYINLIISRGFLLDLSYKVYKYLEHCLVVMILET